MSHTNVLLFFVGHLKLLISQSPHWFNTTILAQRKMPRRYLGVREPCVSYERLELALEQDMEGPSECVCVAIVVACNHWFNQHSLCVVID